MADNVYEGMFILDSNRYARDPGGISGKVETLVKDIGGDMLVSRLWEERRLAYPIKGHRKGTYWLSYFRAGSEKITSLNRQCQITDEILRHLFLKIDPRIVDALVSHATESPDKASPAAGTGKTRDAAKKAGDVKAGEAAKAPKAEEAVAEKTGGEDEQADDS